MGNPSNNNNNKNSNNNNNQFIFNQLFADKYFVISSFVIFFYVPNP